MNTHEIPFVEWGQFVDATKVFAGDLEIVKHPNTPVISPFNGVNVKDQEGHPQYNLVQVADMKEAEFLDEYRKRGIIKIGCMDRDASGPFFNQLPREIQKQTTQFLMAGGGVQLRPTRIEAFKNMLQYLGQNGQHVQEVLVTGHNHKCGYVAYEMGGQGLPDVLGVPPCSDPENVAMKQLLLKTADKVGLKNYFPNANVIFGLEVIDRKGNVQIDNTGFEPLSLKDHPDVAHVISLFPNIA